MTTPENSSSPHWNSTTKLVVGLTLAGLFLMLIIRFQNILAPLLVSVLLAYLFHPLAVFFNKKLKIPWAIISLLLYLIVFAAIIGLLTWGGISIGDQVQNLIKYIQDLITEIPEFFEAVSSQPLKVGPFTFDLSQLELESIWTQLLNVIQPVLSQMGSLIGSLASGVGNTFIWLVFTLLISYFILAESNAAKGILISFQIPSYQKDMSMLGIQLGNIWNAFLRGQLVVILITIAYYTVLLSILGVRYFFLLAILAGLARFVPYVGTAVAWTTYGLVALFQANHYGMLPFPYALLVVGSAWVSDLLLDNFMVPRVMSDALEIHPAAVLVMVIVSASLFGFLGMLLAAPVLASLKLILTYLLRKLSDQDPWTNLRMIPPPEPLKVTFSRLARGISGFAQKTWKLIKRAASGIKTVFLKIQSIFKKGEKNDRQLRTKGKDDR
jgi:predicted PurR-regulated permease PerM